MKRLQVITDDVQIILQPGFSPAQWALFFLLLAVLAFSAMGMGVSDGIRAVPVGRL